MKKEDETEGRKAVFILQELALGLHLVLNPEQEININNNNGTTSDSPRSSDRMTPCVYPSSWSKLFFHEANGKAEHHVSVPLSFSLAVILESR